jgi:hypothetical protein
LIDTHPVLALWLAPLLTAVLMTIFSWLFDSGPITQRILPIIGAALGVFLVTLDLRGSSKSTRRLDQDDE